MGNSEDAPAPLAASVVDFYDGLAGHYHLVHGDRWDEAVQRQGAALDRLIRRAQPAARDILDCSCGIGTQAIGLAGLGYNVRGTDISKRALERAGAEANRLGADVAFGVADFRDLTSVVGKFDVVISCDNAVPHLLDDADVSKALAEMRSKLRPGGLLVISTRDFDRALIARPATAPPILVAGPPRRIVVCLHDWDAPDSPLYTVRFFVLTESGGDWTLAHHSTRYRAITSGALSRAAEDAGFNSITWLTAENAGFHQPVMTAVRPAAEERPNAR